MLIGLIICIILVLVLFVVCIWLLDKYNTEKLKNNKLQSKPPDIKPQLPAPKPDPAQLELNNTLTQQITILKTQIQNHTKELEDIIKHIETASNEYNLNNLRRSNMIEQLNTITDEYLEKQNALTKCADVVDKITNDINLRAQELNGYAEKVHKIESEIADLAAQHKEATKRLTADNEGRIMSITIYEKELLDTLNMLKAHYPQLADNFNQIIWTKIWQPKFQSMTVDLLKKDVCGIYRIFTMDDNGFCRSYVGQAKKIRERWSQHIKKMIGIDKADNNKFYSFVNPEVAHFEVIEECAEANLNTRERYWIDYYNCIENGYNSK